MIDERAIIHPDAKIAEGVTVGPWTMIGAGVELGEGCEIGAHSVIKGPTVIGKNNKIYSFTAVGDDPQDLTYAGEPTCLELGDNNIIREYCTISRGTVKGGGVTRIGNDNFFMAYSHVGHDCQVGSNTVMTNYSALSGHVVLEDNCIIGAYSAVHQFCQVGRCAFITKGTYITKDVLPYVIISENIVSGLNSVGLKRQGFESKSIDALKRAYRTIFRKGLTVQNAVAELELMVSEHPEVYAFIDVLNNSKRGIVR